LGIITQSEIAMSRPQINTSEAGSCGYVCFSHNGKEAEVYANSSYEAQRLAVAYFKPPKSKKHLVHVMLAEKNGETVVHDPSIL
jgi:hypothetical protein